MHITIKGCIAQELRTDAARFLHFDSEAFNVEPGVWPRTEYVLISGHTIEVDVPDIDLVPQQLEALDAQEAELTAKYQAAKTAIEARRQSLLAIEFEAQP